MVQSKSGRFGVVALAGVALASAFCGTASAQPFSDPEGAYAPAPRYANAGHPLTVNRRYAPAPVRPRYDPYDGPQAIVTAPLAAASTLVALPFRIVNGFFPAHGNPAVDPRVLVGAPVHAAGQIAQIPFYVLQAPFRGPDYSDYPAY